jgi:hypothetical protein
LLTFSLLIGAVVYSLKRENPGRFSLDKKIPKNKENFLLIGAFHSLLMLLIASQISGLIYQSQYFWLTLGLAIAVAGTKLKYLPPQATHWKNYSYEGS